MSETVLSRFQKVFTGKKPEERLPLMEWALENYLIYRRLQNEYAAKAVCVPDGSIG